MTHDERWLSKYNEIIAFMAENHRRPSKYNLEENKWNWIRHQHKLKGRGKLKPERVASFEQPLSVIEEIKRFNQYM